MYDDDEEEEESYVYLDEYVYIHTATDIIETGSRPVVSGICHRFVNLGLPSQEVALKHRAKLFDGKSSKDHEVLRELLENASLCQKGSLKQKEY